METSTPVRDESRVVTKLPTEILSHVFSWLDPISFLKTSQACRTFQVIMRGNQSLCRTVYLLQMDKPAHSLDMNWEATLLRLVRLEDILDLDLGDDRDAVELRHLDFVCNSISLILRDASLINNNPSSQPSSSNVSYLQNLSNQESLKSYMQHSSLFERIKYKIHNTGRPHTSRAIDHQLSAKLHCLHGKPIFQAGRTRSAMTYPYACSRVYDMRQHTALTKWGPFRDDDTGMVDWEKVESISIVLGKNAMGLWGTAGVFDDIWDTPFWGSFPRSFVPVKEGEKGELDDQDPYGVAGAWYRIVCFLDYNDFFQHNFTVDSLVPPHIPRPPIHWGEATRLITMKLHVTSIEPPGSDDGQDLPVVHFKGESRSVDDSMDENANSGISGTVRLTKEGEVRWSSISIINGEERWASEGIQVGGVGSARGVVGTWFDRDFDVHGPCGPTAFWKATDAENPQRALLDGISSSLQAAIQPGGIFALGGSPHSSVDGLDFFADEDEDEDWDAELEPVGDDEVPGLLEDAQMDLDVVTHADQATPSNT